MRKLINCVKTAPVFKYIALVIIAMLSALNYEIFISQNSFAPAGINGIGTMVQHVAGFSIGYMSLLINIPMLIVAAFTLNRSYAFRTLTFVLTFSFSLLFLQSIDISPIIFIASDGGAAIMASVAAGFFTGIIYSLSIRLGGSTGGTDIVGAFIHSKFPEYDTVWIVFAINAVVAIASFFVYGLSYQPVILCIIYCFVSSRVGDRILKGAHSALRFEVITKEPEAIATEIIQKLHHGCTVINAKGMYSHKEQTMLICIVNRRQIVDFENILKKYDHTFSSVSDVSRTFGNFKKVK